MLQIDLWKRILICGLCAVGLFLAMPNAFYTRVEQHNDAIALLDSGQSAPELAQQAARWPSFLPSSLVNLGLDLRGGAHLLADVQLADVYEARMQALWPEVRTLLRGERATIGTIRRQASAADEIRLRVSNPEAAPQAAQALQALARPVGGLSGATGALDLEIAALGDEITITLSEAEKQATDERTLRQALEIIRRRIDEVGTREPTIQRQGENRILIQVPGIGSAGELESIIGTTARLTFHPVVARGGQACAKTPAVFTPLTARQWSAARNWWMLSRGLTKTGARRLPFVSTPQARVNSVIIPQKISATPLPLCWMTKSSAPP